MFRQATPIKFYADFVRYKAFLHILTLVPVLKAHQVPVSGEWS